MAHFQDVDEPGIYPFHHDVEVDGCFIELFNITKRKVRLSDNRMLSVNEVISILNRYLLYRLSSSSESSDSEDSLLWSLLFVLLKKYRSPSPVCHNIKHNSHRAIGMMCDLSYFDPPLVILWYYSGIILFPTLILQLVKVAPLA